MAIFKCKMCGGSLEITEGMTVVECEYCTTKQTLPRLVDDKKANLFDRAGHFRRNNEFDKAISVYEKILDEDNTDAEAYWSLVLCKYGIEYVEDPTAHKRVPTVNRAQFTSVFADEDYKSAIQYADGVQKVIYEEEAHTIDEIQKGILAISEKEEPFDVFICYKETDNNGRRTPDSVLANDLYHQLTQEGFKVFFSRITLEDKLGTAYEPYIFAALNSAKVMVVLGTKPEYFDAVWVKNEWSRYLALIKNGGQKILIPAYKDMDPYDLPDEFSHLQAQDMSKLGFMQDLIRGIKKITAKDEPKPVVQERVVVNSSTSINTAPLLERVFLFLEDGKWTEADEYCEKILDLEPKNAEAYLGKLMVDLKVRARKDLNNVNTPFDKNDNFLKAIRFGDAALLNELNSCLEATNSRIDFDDLEGKYSVAISSFDRAASSKEYDEVAKLFEDISGYKNSSEMVQKCRESAAEAKEKVYSEALFNKELDDIMSLHNAIKKLENIRGYKDSERLITLCRERVLELEEKAARSERTKCAEVEVVKKSRKAKRCGILIIVIVLVLAAVGLVVYNNMTTISFSQDCPIYYIGSTYDDVVGWFGSDFILQNGNSYQLYYPDGDSYSIWNSSSYNGKNLTTGTISSIEIYSGGKLTESSNIGMSYSELDNVMNNWLSDIYYYDMYSSYCASADIVFSENYSLNIIILFDGKTVSAESTMCYVFCKELV